MFVRLFCFCLALALLPSCEFRKKKNTTPKPPPAPVKKAYSKIPQNISKSAKKSKQVNEVKQDYSLEEWEGQLPDYTTILRSGVYKEAQLTLVMFYADWCPHCKNFTDLIEEMIKDSSKKIKVLRINADLFPELAQKQKVTAVPKIILYKKGTAVGEFVGAINEEKLSRILQNETKTKQNLETTPL